MNAVDIKNMAVERVAIAGINTVSGRNSRASAIDPAYVTIPFTVNRQIIPNTKVPIARPAKCTGSGRKPLTLYPTAKPKTPGSKAPKKIAKARYGQGLGMLHSGYVTAAQDRPALTLPPIAATTVKNTTGKSSRPSTASGGGVVTPACSGGDGTSTSASGVGT